MQANGQVFDFGVFAIPYEAAAPMGPFLSDPVRDALEAAMRSCGLFDARSEVFLLDRILNPIEAGLISESGIFEYGVNTALMVSSGMRQDAHLAAAGLVSDIDPYEPMPMSTGIILGVRVMKTEPDAGKTRDRIFFAADYELDDEDFPWNDQWNTAVAGLSASQSISLARPRPWTWAPRADLEFVDASEESSALEEPHLRLIEAMMPFATLAKTALDVRQEADGGWIWGGGEQNSSIRTWLGPTDFGNMLETLEDLGIRIEVEEAE